MHIQLSLSLHFYLLYLLLISCNSNNATPATYTLLYHLGLHMGKHITKRY